MFRKKKDEAAKPGGAVSDDMQTLETPQE